MRSGRAASKPSIKSMASWRVSAPTLARDSRKLQNDWSFCFGSICAKIFSISSQKPASSSVCELRRSQWRSVTSSVGKRARWRSSQKSGSLPWMNSAPSSTGTTARLSRCVRILPPRRGRASSTSTLTPPSASSRAAASPAAPAPTMIAVTLATPRQSLLSGPRRNSGICPAAAPDRGHPGRLRRGTTEPFQHRRLLQDKGGETRSRAENKDFRSEKDSSDGREYLRLKRKDSRPWVYDQTEISLVSRAKSVRRGLRALPYCGARAAGAHGSREGVWQRIESERGPPRSTRKKRCRRPTQAGGAHH